MYFTEGYTDFPREALGRRIASQGLIGPIVSRGLIGPIVSRGLIGPIASRRGPYQNFKENI